MKQLFNILLNSIYVFFMCKGMEVKIVLAQNIQYFEDQQVMLVTLSTVPLQAHVWIIGFSRDLVPFLEHCC